MIFCRIARMKRVIVIIAVAALVFACCYAGCARSSGFVSAVQEKLSSELGSVASETLPSELVSTVAEVLSSAAEKAKELAPARNDADGESGEAEGDDGADGGSGTSDVANDGSGTDGGTSIWSLPSPGDISLGSGKFSSAADVALVPTDDYAQSYVFDYGGEEFAAYFDSYSWKVYDSYRITNHGDIVAICQALINEHPVYGSDRESLRTADDMAFEWEQHNLAYKLLPEDSHWRDDAKDVDLDPNDQGKTFPEIYESRTGQPFDIRNYLS